jgi:hypothetical protein
MNKNMKCHIKILKGFDKKNNAFTAIVVLTDKQQEELSNNFFTTNIDLTKYNIVYKQFGHDLDGKIIKDIQEYCDKMNR